MKRVPIQSQGIPAGLTSAPESGDLPRNILPVRLERAPTHLRHLDEVEAESRRGMPVTGSPPAAYPHLESVGHVSRDGPDEEDREAYPDPEQQHAPIGHASFVGHVREERGKDVKIT